MDGCCISKSNMQMEQLHLLGLEMDTWCWRLCKILLDASSISDLHSCISVVNVNKVLKLFLPRGKTLHFSLNFRRFLPSDLSGLSKSCWMAVWSSGESATPFSFVSSVNLLGVHSIPIIQILNENFKCDRIQYWALEYSAC